MPLARGRGRRSDTPEGRQSEPSIGATRRSGRSVSGLLLRMVLALLVCLTIPLPGAAAIESPASELEIPWISLADGIEFATFYLPGPNRVYVARMEIHNPAVTLESMVAAGDRLGRRETVGRMARRYEQSLSAWGGTWGMRRDVVVAINGSFYGPSTGIPYGPQAHTGWFSFWSTSGGGLLTFGWTLDRQVLVSECLATPASQQRIVFGETGTQMPLSGVDIPLPTQGVVLYSPDYMRLVPAVPGSVQVLAEVNRPVMLGADGAQTFAAIREIVTEPRDLRLAFGQIALVAHGESAARLLENASVGATVGIGLELRDLGPGCLDPVGNPWDAVYAGLGSGVFFLVDSQYRPRTDGTEAVRHPRTAVCFNQDYFHFLVVDGRRARWSIGMTLAEMADFCEATLGTTTGINLDGGGSSAMWVDGQILNQPSDGQERAVPDGLMMVSLESSQRSFRFAVGETVEVTAEVDLRLGPGADFGSVGVVTAGSRGEIEHPLSGLEGIFASGTYWWPVTLEQGMGWLPEPALTSAEEAP